MSNSNGDSGTIFAELRDDHEVQRDLFERLEKTQGDESARREGFEKLKNELLNHETAEEKHFYSELMTIDLTQEKTRHSVAEHHEIDEKVEELEAIDFSSSQWLPKLRDLKELVIHHLDEEEEEVFPLAGKALSDKQKTSLGKSYREEVEQLRKG